MEFITGAAMIVVWTQKWRYESEKESSLEETPYTHVERLLIHCMGFVVIPLTYILNREVTKQVIAVENWLMGLKSIFMSREQLEPILDRN